VVMPYSDRRTFAPVGSGSSSTTTAIPGGSSRCCRPGLPATAVVVRDFPLPFLGLEEEPRRRSVSLFGGSPPAPARPAPRSSGARDSIRFDSSALGWSLGRIRPSASTMPFVVRLFLGRGRKICSTSVLGRRTNPRAAMGFRFGRVRWRWRDAVPHKRFGCCCQRSTTNNPRGDGTAV